MHSTNAYPREAATKKHSKFTRPRNENVNATFCFKCTSTISGKFATLRMGKFSAESGRACSHTARCRALPLMPCRGISRCCATTRDVARQRAIMRDARCRATTRGSHAEIKPSSTSNSDAAVTRVASRYENNAVETMCSITSLPRVSTRRRALSRGNTRCLNTP